VSLLAVVFDKVTGGLGSYNGYPFVMVDIYAKFSDFYGSLDGHNWVWFCRWYTNGT